MHESRLVGEFDREEVTQEKIMYAATGNAALGVNMTEEE
jgi:hypothetical protein